MALRSRCTVVAGLVIVALLLGSSLCLVALPEASFRVPGSASSPPEPSPGGTPSSAAKIGSQGSRAIGAPAPANPENCSQGSTTIDVSPSTPDLSQALLADFDTLGLDGGGTIKFEKGTYTLEEMLDLKSYSNVSFQGAGVGTTILSMPVDPVGKFISNTGKPLGLWNYTLNRVVDGSVVDMMIVQGPKPINNFEMCNLTLRAEANNASEDWDGSLLFDTSGGLHHVYSDVAEVGFYGPSTTPNGIHIQGYPGGSLATDYVVENLTASHNSLPYEYNAWARGGPNFLNIGAGQVNCLVQNLSGIGLVALEVGVPQGCLFENWNISGHMLIDPMTGGSWGNTLFENVTVDTNNTDAPNAMGASIANGTAHGTSTFSGMRWNHDTFYGNVLYSDNMVDVENSTFYGGLNETPSIFTNNYVLMTDSGPNRVNFPIQVDGCPSGGASSNFSGNTFVFPNSTFRLDPFVLNVPLNDWWNDTIEISGRSTGYLLRAPDLSLARDSVFSGISYVSLGNNSPNSLILMDLADSPNFVDLGATVQNLTQIDDNLPQYAPTPPSNLQWLARSATTVQLTWTPSGGNVTNYTIFAGTEPAPLTLSYSAGLVTTYLVGELQPATEYYFNVVAWNSSFPSAPSEILSISTKSLPQYIPGTPSGLAVAAVGTTNVALSWNPSSGNVTNYTVLISTAPLQWAQRISAGLVLSWNVSGLAPDTMYSFAVEAWNATWFSPVSASVSATTQPSTSSSPPSTSPPGASTPSPATGSGSTGWVLSASGRLLLIVIVVGLLAVVLGALAGLGARARRARRYRNWSRSRSRN